MSSLVARSPATTHTNGGGAAQRALRGAWLARIKGVRTWIEPARLVGWHLWTS